MKTTLRILHLEDLQSDAELINMQLHKANMEFENIVVDTKPEFINALKEFNPDIILADHSLTAFNSMEALKIVNEANRNVPFLLVTTAASDEFVNNIIKEGAKGYILKDNLDKLPDAIKAAMGNNYNETYAHTNVEAEAAEEKLYDLKMLEEMDDVDYLLEITSIFLTETPKEIKEMLLAAMANKASIVGGKAHKLKSSAGLVEAHKLTRILMQIEAEAKTDNSGTNLLKLAEAANEEYKKIEVSLKEYLKALA